MSKIRNPFKHDSYGTRIKAHRLTNKPENIYKRRSVSIIATLLFVATDFTCLYTMWRDSMAAANAILVMLTCIAMAALLDVPLAIAAHSVKEYEQGLVSKNAVTKITALSIASFLTVFLPNIAFRFVTIKSVMMDDLDNNTLLAAAVFLAVLPLATSFGSFVITYFSSNPLADRIFIKEQSLIRIETNIEEAHECLAQIGSHLEYLEAVIAREDDAYANAINATNTTAANIKQIARLCIAERLNTPSDINVTIKSSKDVNGKAKTEVISTDEMIDFADKYIVQSTPTVDNDSADKYIVSSTPTVDNDPADV